VATTIFGIALPFFAVLVCGMLAGRLKLLDDAGLMGLNAFVFWFALPALLFLKVSATPLARLTDPHLYLVYEGSCIILYGVVFAVARWIARLDTAHAAMCAFTAAWGNVGYMGVPLLVAAYGEGQALPAVVAVVLDSLILQSLTILILESSLGAHRGGLWAVGRSVIRNPLIAAVIAGAVVAASGVALPLPVKGFLEILGPAAGPGALFALGATLRGFGGGTDLRLVGWITAAKLLLLPVIAFAMLQLLPLPQDLVVPTLITTALPSAASVFVIAQRYGIMERPVAAVVFISHLVGILTLTLLLAILGV
jgi:predicted permease